MSAGGLLRELDNFPVILLPNGKGCVSAPKAGNIDVRRDRFPDDAIVPVVIGDVEHSVPVLNVKWVLDVNLRFKDAKRHIHSPPPNTTEQGDIGTNPENKRNTLIEVIDGLSTVLRRTVKPFRLVSPETTQADWPTPANDNEDWREAA